MGTLVPLTTEDWARIRYEYESTDRKLFDICAERGMSEGTLRDRMRRWSWKRRRGPVPREGPAPMVVPIIEVNGVVAQQDAQRGDDDAGDDTCEDLDELRESLKRQIDALIEEEREARPRRYLAAWEEFAAEAAKPKPQRRRPLSPRPSAS